MFPFGCPSMSACVYGVYPSASFLLVVLRVVLSSSFSPYSSSFAWFVSSSASSSDFSLLPSVLETVSWCSSKMQSVSFFFFWDFCCRCIFSTVQLYLSNNVVRMCTKEYEELSFVLRRWVIFRIFFIEEKRSNRARLKAHSFSSLLSRSSCLGFRRKHTKEFGFCVCQFNWNFARKEFIR